MGSLLAGWLAVRYRLASLQWTLCTCSFKHSRMLVKQRSGHGKALVRAIRFN